MLKYTKIASNFHLVTNIVPDRYKVEFNLQYSAGGGYFEKEGQKGVSHLLEHCILGRTKDKDFYALKDYLFEKSIYNNAATGVLTMYLTMSGHRNDAKEMLDLLLEFGFNPTLDQDVMNREREIVLREMSERRGEPSYRLYFEIANKILEPGSRYLHEVLGEKEDVEKATLDTFYDLHRGILERSQHILSISGGGLEIEQINEAVAKIVSKVPPNPNVLDLTYDPGNKLKQFKYQPIVSKLAHDHADLSISIPVDVTLENRPSRYFLQALLLKMPDGELYNRLRNELGWIYSIQSNFDRSTSTLNLDMSCEIKYITSIVDEVKNLFSDFDKVFSPKKAETIKQITVKRQEMSLDEPQIITDFLVENLTEFGVPISYSEYVENLRKVTTEDIKAVFDQLKNNLNQMRIVTVSNKKEIEKLVF